MHSPRRDFLRNTACGFGGLAFSALASQAARAEGANQAAAVVPAGEAAFQPHFAPRAKRVIFLFMQGGVSHVDSFDRKPRLDADDG